jgi:Sugar kinases, ribokinase family
MFDVACIGILVADSITKTMDEIPEKGTLKLIDNIALFSGGCAMNAAIDLAKLGANTALIGIVGNDGYGDFLKAELTRHGVNLDGLVTSKSIGTSASVVLLGSNAERTFLHYAGANAIFTERLIDYHIIENSKIVFVGGCMLMPTFDGEECAILLQKAKFLGKTTVLDTAWDDTGRWMELLQPCMPLIDYFIPSIDEAQKLSGKTDPAEIADVFFDMGVKSVVIKLGKHGCYMRETRLSEGKTLPTYNQFKAVDTTGAGDSFCAGFLYGLAKELPMEECVRLANAVGTHCVMATGATTGIKSYDDMITFMEENA